MDLNIKKTGGIKKVSIASTIPSPPPRRFQPHHVRSRSSNKILGGQSKPLLSEELAPILADDANVSYGGTGSSVFSRNRKESSAVVPVPPSEMKLKPNTPRIKHYKSITNFTDAVPDTKHKRKEDIVRGSVSDVIEEEGNSVDDVV